MRIYRGLGELPKRPSPAAVTIGNFYALHRGHRALVRKVGTLAASIGGISTVVTFEPHPAQVLHGESPVLLVTAERKLELLAQAGIRRALSLPFTREFSMVEPEEFIEEILVRRLNMKALVVGANFRFGHFARGDVTMLRSFSTRFGFKVVRARLAQAGGRSISSTAIRHALQEGDLEWANQALGRPYGLPGRIVRGSGRGRELGYPTANLEPVDNLCIPAAGIYGGSLLLQGKRFPAAISIGTNPTFGPGPLSVEAYVLDFEGDLYGLDAEIEFLRRLRDHEQFADAKRLKAAISQDVEQVRGLMVAKGRSKAAGLVGVVASKLKLAEPVRD